MPIEQCCHPSCIRYEEDKNSTAKGGTCVIWRTAFSLCGFKVTEGQRCNLIMGEPSKNQVQPFQKVEGK